MHVIETNCIIIKKKMRWLKLAYWHIGIFAIWLTRKWANDYHQFVSSSSQGLEDIQNSLSFQLAIWVIIITIQKIMKKFACVNCRFTNKKI